MKNRIFSGIQPSGTLHIGNYLGAIVNWVKLQEEYESFFCIVDLHAITVKQDPKILKQKIREVAAIYLATGIDLQKSVIFVQSHRPEHAELGWILNTITYISELERMTQFKDKSKRHSENINTGLFDYPVLMAADILLYKTKIVPVGEDQLQHIELTRDIAKRFNNTFGETFIVPKADIRKDTARIMGLDNPSEKMSKSAKSLYNYIALTDSADTIREKIKKAVTDTGKEIKYDEKNKPAISNLLNIYRGFTDEPISEIEERYRNKGYADFKKDLAEVIINGLEKFHQKFNQLQKEPQYLEKILKDGADKAGKVAIPALEEVKNKVGLG
ncbi:tryptophan--tRNA ligase [bacterium CG_4_10_14_0_2_um_filter_33_32]|nr:MAG: tryptophan--tRNA ligase [bacterium CG2_30_33_46]PIR67457.1 MAG: tryptophan--tRNA ligase [bacterium CG10_big_fil_rev_8_21_14_0_10_33_18]PIU76377.1 MAG: tryptophan--tRNA ligase [bacterium CG06_land_8_20_14_3_00_33_50]PIW81263.1 MAG: tryptophan--tRNA ligase [bacterium CG_4_8_14_3_um_filter_33_28]PIZ85834.1 MAG: tryptophan--tRNA ligase [bacterium CG_4_10_14_0_2_um_filter_33_32]PJA72648.1 MAG: tryptophan--tRNA ligase [bacterium CG_4_9_14_3_um_filter_33_26]